MVTQDLVDYIKSNLASGMDTEALKTELRGHGWANDDIDTAFVSATSGAQAEAVHAETPSSGWHIGKKEIFITIAGLLLLGAAGAAAYFVVPPSPEKVMKASAANLATIHSFDYSGNLVVDVSAPSGLFSMDTLLHGFVPNTNSKIAGVDDTKFNIDFTGTADVTDASHPKSNLNLNFNYSLFSFGMEMRLLDKIVYLKFNNLPKIPDYDINKYSGVWIKVDPADISKEYGLDIEASSKQPDLTSGQKQQILDLAANAHFFNSIVKLPDDKIDDKSMYHYAVDVDMKGVRDYYREVQRIENSAKSTDAELDNITVRNTEVWVGKSDKMIHKLLTKISASSPAGTTTQTSGSINIALNLKNYNQPSTIVAPVSYKNFLDVLKEFIKPISVSAPVPVK
jgi:hypothetical protein